MFRAKSDRSRYTTPNRELVIGLDEYMAGATTFGCSERQTSRSGAGHASGDHDGEYSVTQSMSKCDAAGVVESGQPASPP